MCNGRNLLNTISKFPDYSNTKQESVLEMNECKPYPAAVAQLQGCYSSTIEALQDFCLNNYKYLP